MPELPDIELYLHALQPRVVGQVLSSVQVTSPFVLRTFEPPIEAAEGAVVRSVGRMGKRFVFALDRDELYIVVHLMIAGRWRWLEKPGAKAPGKVALAAFRFPTGLLVLTEQGTQKRASLHLVRGRDALATFSAGGLDVLRASVEAFSEALGREKHTLKRSLTDPRLFDGIGNAYSDEILHAARLSPVKLTSSLSPEEIERLHVATQVVLMKWKERLVREYGDRFPGPGEVTAFRPDFAVHGRYGKPCPVCQTAVQRIRYAENETDYCPRCQTGGVVLADRSMSRLLKGDWPRRIEELE